MFINKLLLTLIGFVASILMASVVFAGGDRPTPRLGKAATPEDVAAWNITIFPDGTGLPAGRGTAAEGKPLFAQQCASCHGDEGIGGTGGELAGGNYALNSESPDKNIGLYWPFATTIFDFTRRAMPMNAPGSLTADQAYALTAYLLFRNGIIGADNEMNAASLPKLNMPNRDGFIWIDVAQPRSSKPK